MQSMPRSVANLTFVSKAVIQCELSPVSMIGHDQRSAANPENFRPHSATFRFELGPLCRNRVRGGARMGWKSAKLHAVKAKPAEFFNNRIERHGIGLIWPEAVGPTAN